MAAEYFGYDSDDLAQHVASLITKRTGRVWDGEANERLSVWLADSSNRSMATEWLVYVGEAEDDLIDPMKEFALRQPMVEALTVGYHEPHAGFVARLRHWSSPRR